MEAGTITNVPGERIQAAWRMGIAISVWSDFPATHCHLPRLHTLSWTPLAEHAAAPPNAPPPHHTTS